jgi:hypothetical protein
MQGKQRDKSRSCNKARYDGHYCSGHALNNEKVFLSFCPNLSCIRTIPYDSEWLAALSLFVAAAAIVVAIAVGFVFYQIYANPAASSSGYEGIDYDDLVAREVLVTVARTTEIVPDRACFDGERISDLLPGLTGSLIEADAHYAEEEEEIRASLQNVTSSADVEASNDQAIKLLQQHCFKAAIDTTSRNFQRISDNTYAFECYLDQGGKQYLLRISFDTYYPMSSRFVAVNFTRSDSGLAIANPDIIVSSGDVNVTVLFVNKLDSTVRLIYEDPMTPQEETQLRISDRAIPPGKMLQVNYGRYNPPDFDSSNPYIKTFSYTVEPYGISGTVTKHPHPLCITDVKEAKSYYAPDGVALKFPSYLPDGYSLGCGVHASNYSFVASYGNSSLLAKHQNGAFNDEFVAEGGIRISYHNMLILSFWDESIMAESRADEPRAGTEGATLEEIDGNPSVISSRTVNINGEESKINAVQIFMDVESYTIQSSLSDEELIKIAESLQ